MSWRPWLIALLVTLLAVPLAPLPAPKPVLAQATRCPEAAARAQPLPGDTASSAIAPPEDLASWRLDGEVGQDARRDGVLSIRRQLLDLGYRSL